LPAIDADGAAEISARAAARLDAAVREAGSLALSMFGKPIKQWTKGASASPVSETDIAVDTLLRERLTGGSNAIAWLSEETADDAARLTSRYVWVVDPIDGTRAYLAGQPDWAISAALVENGRPIAACLYAPALDEFFAARADAGSTLNGNAIAATPGADLHGIRVAEISGTFKCDPTAFHQAATGTFAGAAVRTRRTRPLRCRLCRRQQPRLGPCSSRSFGAPSGRRAHAAGGRNNRL